MKSKLFKIFSMLMILSLMVLPASAQSPAAEGSSGDAARAADAQATGNYIVVLQEPAVALYAGGVAGLQATALAEGQKINSRSPEVQAYVAHLDGHMDKFVGTLEKSLGREIQQLGRTHYLVTGIVLKLTAAEAKTLERNPAVAEVFEETIEYLDTDAGPTWIGAPGIWDGTAVPNELGTWGENVVVGIIDSGINSDHPSFADVGDDAYDHTNPLGSGVYLGVCDSTDPSYDPSFVCNDKLIGAYEYSYLYYDDTNPVYLEYPSPEDEDGHGSHTASTTAGNVVTATLWAPTTAFTTTISGVAPHANIIAYDVCSLNVVTLQGPCWGGALFDAVDQAFADGVDVINYSISGGTNPATDYIERMFGYMAYFNNTFVSTSAGNSGPTASTVAHRSPWVTSTAAATHNRQFSNELTDMAGGSTTAPADILGKGFTSGLGSTPIVYAGDYYTSTAGTPSVSGAALCTPDYFLPDTFDGEIVVCDRGTYGRVAKAAEVARVGAGGYVLANDAASGASLVADAFPIPGVHISYADGVILKTWMATGSGHVASIAGNYQDLDVSYADITASFSSRGPNPAFDILKPDVTAPGVDIWAAVNTEDPLDPPEYGLLSGTSMSSPHNAGAAALLKAVYPSMAVARLRSMMMLTSQPDVVPGSVNAKGAGRIDLNKAALSGLVMPQSIYDMLFAFYFDSGQDFRTFNLASIMDTQCVVECTWERTFRSNLDFSAIYTATFETYTPGFDVTITPSTFTLNPGDAMVVEFTMDVSQIAVGDYAEGMAWLDTNATFPVTGDEVSDAHLPILVRSKLSNLPASIDVTAYDITGTHELPGILVANDVDEVIVDTYGLSKGEISHMMVEGDPTNDDAYDLAAGGVFYKLVTVPANTQRFVAEIVHATSLDVDMFVGRDTDLDGMPDASEQVASSATGAIFEYVNIDNPVADTYWVLVQNWGASGDTLDLISLSTGVVPKAESGNLDVTAPISLTAGVPFSVDLDWDIPTLLPGDRYYGAFALGSLVSGDLGTTRIDFHHTYSAMFAYYDGEGVVEAGETVSVAGAFNSWVTTANVMEDQGGALFTEYTFDMAYCSATSGYKYVIDTGTTDEYDFLNTNDRSAEVCEDAELDYLDWRNIEPGYFILQGTSPYTLTTGIFSATYTVEVWAQGLTEAAGEPRALMVELGYGTTITPSTWTHWTPMDWSSQEGNNDAFTASIIPFQLGTYYVAGAINGNWAWGNPNYMWSYADMDWDNTAFVIEDAAVLYVLRELHLMPLMLK